MSAGAESLGHDLLLLMLSLSRMQDRERIVRLFVEAMNAAARGVVVRLLAAGEQTAGEVVEIATPEAHFGRIAVEDPGAALSLQERGALRNAARMLAVVLENISRAERLASENARLDAAVAARTRELLRALERSEDLYQNAPCGYHSLDANGVFVRVNDTELRWLGYAREEVVSRLAIHDLLAPESQPVFDAAFAALKQRGEVHDVELDLVRKDGTRLPVLLSATAVVARDGPFVMSRATIYDLSERRRAERALRETEERFRQSQKLEALGRLAGGIAHDFNNLLTIILSCSDALLESMDPADRLRQEAAEISEAGAKAAQLTRQLLAFGRRQATKPLALDLGETVRGMEKMLRRLIGEDVELDVRCGPGLRRVRVDPAKMEQVVLNLVVNARDAMPGGGRISVETANVALERSADPRHDLPAGDYVRLSVGDTGGGMSAEIQAHLFEPFFTTKAEGKGTGLGLATVYGIVKQARGDVRVETAPGRGTRFDVLLPAMADAAIRADGAAAVADAAEQLQRGNETVLLVEDEPRVRAVTADALRRAGYTVLEASDGEMAIEVAATAPRLDVLVTDLVMPRVGGAQLAARLRALRGDIRVVFVSGYGGAAPAGVGPGDADAAVLQKPFTAAALTRAIRERLDGGAARR